MVGHDITLVEHLIDAVRAHVGVESVVGHRPLLGVALQLPDYADVAEIAQAIDAEQVTAGFITFDGRVGVAVPADEEHIAQTAHSVAKVLHIILEIHTDYINERADACPLVFLPAVTPIEQEASVVGVLETVNMLLERTATIQRVTLPPELATLLADGLTIAQENLKELCA